MSELFFVNPSGRCRLVIYADNKSRKNHLHIKIKRFESPSGLAPLLSIMEASRIYWATRSAWATQWTTPLAGGRQSKQNHIRAFKIHHAEHSGQTLLVIISYIEWYLWDKISVLCTKKIFWVDTVVLDFSFFQIIFFLLPLLYMYYILLFYIIFYYYYICKN